MSSLLQSRRRVTRAFNQPASEGEQSSLSENDSQSEIETDLSQSKAEDSDDSDDSDDSEEYDSEDTNSEDISDDEDDEDDESDESDADDAINATASETPRETGPRLVPPPYVEVPGAEISESTGKSKGAQLHEEKWALIDQLVNGKWSHESYERLMTVETEEREWRDKFRESIPNLKTSAASSTSKDIPTVKDRSGGQNEKASKAESGPNRWLEFSAASKAIELRKAEEDARKISSPVVAKGKETVSKDTPTVESKKCVPVTGEITLDSVGLMPQNSPDVIKEAETEWNTYVDEKRAVIGPDSEPISSDIADSPKAHEPRSSDTSIKASDPIENTTDIGSPVLSTSIVQETPVAAPKTTLNNTPEKEAVASSQWRALIDTATIGRAPKPIVVKAQPNLRAPKPSRPPRPVNTTPKSSRPPKNGKGSKEKLPATTNNNLLDYGTSSWSNAQSVSTNNHVAVDVSNTETFNGVEPVEESERDKNDTEKLGWGEVEQKPASAEWPEEETKVKESSSKAESNRKSGSGEKSGEKKTKQKSGGSEKSSEKQIHVKESNKKESKQKSTTIEKTSDKENKVEEPVWGTTTQPAIVSDQHSTKKDPNSEESGWGSVDKKVTANEWPVEELSTPKKEHTSKKRPTTISDQANDKDANINTETKSGLTASKSRSTKAKSAKSQSTKSSNLKSSKKPTQTTIHDTTTTVTENSGNVGENTSIQAQNVVEKSDDLNKKLESGQDRTPGVLINEGGWGEASAAPVNTEDSWGAIAQDVKQEDSWERTVKYVEPVKQEDSWKATVQDVKQEDSWEATVQGVKQEDNWGTTAQDMNQEDNWGAATTTGTVPDSTEKSEWDSGKASRTGGTEDNSVANPGESLKHTPALNQPLGSQKSKPLLRPRIPEKKIPRPPRAPIVSGLYKGEEASNAWASWTLSTSVDVCTSPSGNKTKNNVKTNADDKKMVASSKTPKEGGKRHSSPKSPELHKNDVSAIQKKSDNKEYTAENIAEHEQEAKSSIRKEILADQKADKELGVTSYLEDTIRDQEEPDEDSDVVIILEADARYDWEKSEQILGIPTPPEGISTPSAPSESSERVQEDHAVDIAKDATTLLATAVATGPNGQPLIFKSSNKKSKSARSRHIHEDWRKRDTPVEGSTASNSPVNSTRSAGTRATINDDESGNTAESSSGQHYADGSGHNSMYMPMQYYPMQYHSQPSEGFTDIPPSYYPYTPSPVAGPMASPYEVNGMVYYGMGQPMMHPAQMHPPQMHPPQMQSYYYAPMPMPIPMPMQPSFRPMMASQPHQHMQHQHQHQHQQLPHQLPHQHQNQLDQQPRDEQGDVEGKASKTSVSEDDGRGKSVDKEGLSRAAGTHVDAPVYYYHPTPRYFH
ncbi:hypothetical protein J3Q64DRAFT_1844510 [Phycomyces blakesleeanus]|uniref:Btz domain-containing protein n=1 Tax=Phycomyces blakesleeanus TaxID=4837 RepID=A0ABR3BE63_PHYBL